MSELESIYITECSESIEDFLKYSMSEKQKRICKFLNEISDHSLDLYKAGLYAFFKKDFPARCLVSAHCFNELINSLIRLAEQDCKEQFTTAIKSLDFVQKADNSEKDILGTIDKVWSNVRVLQNERAKLYTFLKNYRPMANDNNILELVNKVKHYKESLQTVRHINATPQRWSEKQFQDFVEKVDNYLYACEQPYNEMKIAVDEILTKSQQKLPTPKDIQILLRALKGNLRPYFFLKLESPAWFESLKELQLLNFSIIKQENGYEEFYWEAFPYLYRIANIKYAEILDLLHSTLKDIKLGNFSNFSCIQQILKLASQFPNKEFIDVMSIFYDWLKTIDNIDGFIDIDSLKNVLNHLFSVSKSNTSILIITRLLHLNIKIVEKKALFPIDKKNTYESFDIVPIFNNMGYFYYEHVVNIVKKNISEYQFLYFQDLANIIDDLYKNLSDDYQKQLDFHLEIFRAAIENHEQDWAHKTDPLYMLISIVRDVGECIIKTNNEKKIKNLFSFLSLKKPMIFARLALHLLRIYQKAPIYLLKKFLVNKRLLCNTIVYHEYFLLLQEKYGKLSRTSQETLLQYIKKGSDYKNFSVQNDDIWKGRWFLAIKNYLSAEDLKKYSSFIEKLNEWKHPDFTSYSETRRGSESPKSEDELALMSIPELIDTIDKFNPTGRFGEPDILGFAQIIEKDVVNRPQKYLENLNLFKRIKEPTYFRYLIQGLKNVKKSQSNWDDILNFGEWISKQDDVIFEDKNDSLKDHTWYYTHCELIRLISELFKSENMYSQKRQENIYCLLKKFVYRQDSFLEKEHEDDEYYSRAINSLHGAALEVFIKYGLWLYNNGENQIQLFSILDNLLNSSHYLETFSIIGRYLPWLEQINHQWTIDNIDNIMPEKNVSQFDASWLTYINYVHPYRNMYEIIKNKIEYVLKEKDYRMHGNKYDKHISYHIAVYYFQGFVTLDSEIMKILFSEEKNKEERYSLLRWIGMNLQEENNPFPDFFPKCQKIWEYWREIILGEEKENIEELSLFAFWYKTRALDVDWAINELHNIIVNHHVYPSILIFEEALTKDISQYTRKVFDILSCYLQHSNLGYYEEKDLALKCMEYIKENNFENDYKLKTDKNQYINSLGEKYGPEIFDCFSPYLDD